MFTCKYIYKNKYHHYSSNPKIINRKFFTQSCRPKEETDLVWDFRLPHTFPRETLRSSQKKRLIKRFT